MYQTFGAREVDNTGCARFRVFIPDNALDPAQYENSTLPNIAKVHAIGDFAAALGKTNLAPDPAFELAKSKFTDPEDGKTKGWLYELTTPALPADFYQYKFHLTY